MMRSLLCGVLLLAGTIVYGKTVNDSLLKQLNSTIEQAPALDAEKLRQIAALRQWLQYHAHAPLLQQFDTCRLLYEHYKAFQYDSAFACARRLHDLGRRMNDSTRMDYATVKLAFVLLSSGMFKETGDYLQTINIAHLPDSIKAEYYTLKARYYYDLSDYSSDSYFAPRYVHMGNACTDSALQLFAPGSFHADFNRGLMYQKMDRRDSAKYYFARTIARSDLTWHQVAIATSSLGNIYITEGRKDSAIALMARAAIADIRSCTKETTAMFILAGLLFRERDVKHASRYIEYAVADASFYGARLRKVQTSAILPIIEGEKINTVEAQKKLLFVYAAIVTLLLIALVILAVIINKQYKKLKAAQQVITAAHARQQEINERLQEANKIKEEYIGYCFQVNSAYIDKLKKFKKQIDQKLADNRLGEARYLVNNINLKEEREELFRHFDRIFLKIFPRFVAEFNALFPEEDHIILKDNELLNTDLRIFALIRIGISDNVKIAQILEYSVNTIYAYKTRIKNKAMVPKEEFEDRIMSIRTI